MQFQSFFVQPFYDTLQKLNAQLHDKNSEFNQDLKRWKQVQEEKFGNHVDLCYEDPVTSWILDNMQFPQGIRLAINEAGQAIGFDTVSRDETLTGTYGFIPKIKGIVNEMYYNIAQTAPELINDNIEEHDGLIRKALTGDASFGCPLFCYDNHLLLDEDASPEDFESPQFMFVNAKIERNSHNVPVGITFVEPNKATPYNSSAQEKLKAGEATHAWPDGEEHYAFTYYFQSQEERDAFSETLLYIQHEQLRHMGTSMLLGVAEKYSAPPIIALGVRENPNLQPGNGDYYINTAGDKIYKDMLLNNVPYNEFTSMSQVPEMVKDIASQLIYAANSLPELPKFKQIAEQRNTTTEQLYHNVERYIKTAIEETIKVAFEKADVSDLCLMQPLPDELYNEQSRQAIAFRVMQEVAFTKLEQAIETMAVEILKAPDQTKELPVSVMAPVLTAIADSIKVSDNFETTIRIKQTLYGAPGVVQAAREYNRDNHSNLTAKTLMQQKAKPFMHKLSKQTKLDLEIHRSHSDIERQLI